MPGKTETTMEGQSGPVSSYSEGIDMTDELGNLTEDCKTFCSVESLAFRAACNEAVNEATRPIKRRVMARIAASNDARAIIYTTWRQIDHDNAGRPTDCFSKVTQALIQDPGWRTLVLEEVQSERQWRDLIHGNFKAVWDRLSSILEKLRDHEHPVARGATGVLVALLTLWVPYTIDPDGVKNLTLPIRVALTGEANPLHARFITASDGKAIPVTFTPRLDPETLSVQFASSRTPVPVRFAIEETKGHPSSSAPEVGALPKAADDLHTIALGIIKLAGTPELPKSAMTQSADVEQSAPGELSQMVAEFQRATKSLNTVIDNQAKLETELKSLDQKQTRLEVAEQNHAPATTVALAEGVPQSVAIEWFDATSGTVACNVEITARNIQRSVHIIANPSSCFPNRVQLKAAESDLSVGVPWNADQIGCKITVHEVENHWFGKKYVIATIAPYTFSSLGSEALASSSLRLGGRQ
jgi:hypothetical protein